jgi:RNA polymerase sigma-70 factor (ECF subfamily)
MVVNRMAPTASIPATLDFDREAFTVLYHAHHQSVFRFALHMTGDPAGAAEVTQDVFVWLMHHPNKYDPARGEPGAFLTGVARKMLHRRERSLRRWLPFGRELENRTAAPQLDQAIDATFLRRAVASLPVRYREAVVLCDLESASYEEAAAALQCAAGTVKSRVHRGRELLARKLGVTK